MMNTPESSAPNSALRIPFDGHSPAGPRSFLGAVPEHVGAVPLAPSVARQADNDAENVLQAFRAGIPARMIAKIFGISPASVANIKKAGESVKAR